VLGIRKNQTAVIPPLKALGAGFIGCGGGGTDIKASNTTVGQELMDLEKEYKDGIITEKEYNNTKSKILKRKY